MRLLVALCLAGCIPASSVRTDPSPLPEPIEERTKGPALDLQFLRDTPPVEGELFVCGIVEPGLFSCIEFEEFMRALQPTTYSVSR